MFSDINNIERVGSMKQGAHKPLRALPPKRVKVAVRFLCFTEKRYHKRKTLDHELLFYFAWNVISHMKS